MRADDPGTPRRSDLSFRKPRGRQAAARNPLKDRAKAITGGPAPDPAGRLAGAARRAAPPLWRRLLPLAALLCLSIAALVYLNRQGWDLDTVAQHRAWLMAQVDAEPLLSGLVLFAAYLVCTALSLPLGSMLTVVAGFFLGWLPATLWVLGGATVGSIAVFLAARGALHDTLAARAGPWLRRMERGFREHAFSYLLVLRLLPIFPFWLVNLVPALLGVPLRVFVAATAIGIVPGTIVFASLGGGLGEVMDRGERPDLGLLLDPQILLPLLGLSVLALLPVAWKRWRRRRGTEPDEVVGEGAGEGSGVG